MTTCLEKFGYVPPACDEDITINEGVVSCKRCGNTWKEEED